MTHYTQFRSAFIRQGAKDNGCTLSEFAECMEEQTCLDAWWAFTVNFLRMGGMYARWWNSVMKNAGTYGKVARWMHDNPAIARNWGHDKEWALAHVRRDSKAAMERAENAIEPDRSGCDANAY